MPKEWRPRGQVHLWRFLDNNRNYPGWNVAADPDGLMALIEIVPLLEVGRFPFRTIPVAPPPPEVLRRANNAGGAARVWSPGTWKIHMRTDDLGVWSFPDADPASLMMGAHRAAEFAAALRHAKAGTGDFCVGQRPRTEPGSPSQTLWFW